MVNEEQLWRITHRMEAAAERAERAADRIEEATQRLAFMFENGYGGNALRLIELLENTDVQEGTKE